MDNSILSNDKESITKRWSMLWEIRQMKDKEEAIKILSNGLKSSSALLKHEIAYVMGQLAHKSAIPYLNELLSNKNEDTMVRHEAAEALGAIGDVNSITILSKYLNDNVREVRETCYLAIKSIEAKQKNENCSSGIFESIDPTPTEDIQKTSIKKLIQDFLNINEDLYKRYKAMFALRNLAQNGDEEALNALCNGFKQDDGALFKHEIAFVLGQLQNKKTTQILQQVLKNKNEHAMVRHEAAEALGSIADDKALNTLKEFQNDPVKPVSESCTIAIDMHEYWKQFN